MDTWTAKYHMCQIVHVHQSVRTQVTTRYCDYCIGWRWKFIYKKQLQYFCFAVQVSI